MKSILCIALVLLSGIGLQAQQSPAKWAKKANHLTYHIYSYGQKVDTAKTFVALTKEGYTLYDEPLKGTPVPGVGRELTVVKPQADTMLHYLGYDDTTYCYGRKLSRNDIHWDTVVESMLRMRYICSINSNRLEFVMEEGHGMEASPLPHYGRMKGVLTEFWRNGQLQLQLVSTEVRKTDQNWIGEKPLRQVSPRQMNNIQQQRMVITTRVFDEVQLSWGKENSHIEDNIWDNTPYDSVLHFAGGTLALKRMRLPVLPKHYQTFLELHQRSNGDAYDRTGSVFVVPTGYFGETFLTGIMRHCDSLPIHKGRDGQRYQGMVASRQIKGEWVWRYQPPVELMRFFTSFGVGHFNDRVQLDGLEWEQENYFKQEVTDLSGYLQGEDVWIGIWIGNYDGGGHLVTMDLKSYPGEPIFDGPTAEGDDELCQPLFNTCNVLEMAGQNYGKLFGTDSLTVEFQIEEGAKQRLRYIATGHGGWDGGDEFNPKTHTLLIDGEPAFTYIPWRCDCGRYREWNPVSGNFWNGTSSSDYSRSGWCPGTATQPVYFDLSGLKPGKHTLTVAIPQGAPLEGSFSYWCVSGVIINN